MAETPISGLDLISKAQIDPANDIIGLVDKSDTAMSINGSNKKTTIESLVNSVLDNFSWGDIGGDIGDQTDLSLVLAALDSAKLDTADFNFATINGSAGDNVSLASALALKLNKAGDTMTGALLSSLGTITANTPGISLTQTWNNSGATFDLLSATVTRTTANTNSRWINFNNANNWGGNAIPYFQVGVATGAIAITGMWGTASLALGNTSIGGSIETVYQDGFLFKQYTTNVLYINTGSYQDRGLECQQSGMAIGWTDLKMRRDGANTLALYRTTNAQRFNLYGTRTDGSNYRRFYISSTTGGAFTLGVEGLGTGASGNTLTINNYTSFSSGIGTAAAVSISQYDTVNDTQVSIELRNTADRSTVNTGIAFRPGPTAHYAAYINGVTNSTWNSLADSSLRFFVARNNNSTTVSLSHLHQVMSLTAASVNITPEALTSGSPTGFLFTGPAYTTLTATTEATDVNWNLTRSVQFSTGAITTQRAFRIQAPTYTFVGASTITNASTLAISGAPVAGTNATITNSYALNVENGALGVGIAGVDHGRIIIQDSGQLSSNNAIRVHAGGIYLGQGISVFTVLHNGSVYVRGTLTTDSLGGGIVTHNMSFDGGWGNLTRAVTTPQGSGNRFANIYGLQIACGNNYGLMVTGSNSNIQLYNTFTDSNNYIRQSLSFTTYSSTVHAQHIAEGLGTGAVNIPVVISPRGTGAFILGPMPDGTSVGGNARGANAIDLQLNRSAATQVASGNGAICIGNSCTSMGGFAIGSNASVGTFGAIAFGSNVTANGTGGIAIGLEGASAAGWNSIAVGVGSVSGGNCSLAIGPFATTSRSNEITFGFRHNAFNIRPGGFLLSANTTDATPTAMQLRNLNGNSNFTTRTNTVLHGTLHVTGVNSSGTSLAIYTRRVVFKNVGGTVTLVESQTVGTDYEDNAATSLTITGTSPFFEVTGIAGESWRWAGWFTPTCEIDY